MELAHIYVAVFVALLVELVEQPIACRTVVPCTRAIANIEAKELWTLVAYLVAVDKSILEVDFE